VEVLAKRGYDTLVYGPMKPVGLRNPHTGTLPYGVVQLRQDTLAGDLYNLVGFQTNLRYGEQDRVLRLIPGLEQAEFVRYGSMHVNTFINSPTLLSNTLQMKDNPYILWAGQITGVEGYVEAAGTGWLAGVNAAILAAGKEPLSPPPATMLGALVRYITTSEARYFQPMNAVYGILPTLETESEKDKRSFAAGGEMKRKLGKRERQEGYLHRSLEELKKWIKKL